MFLPSVSLTQKLIGYQGWVFSRFSRKRLDSTPTHIPVFGSKVSVDNVQENIRIQFERMLGTMVWRAAFQGTQKVQITENGVFTNVISKMIRECLNLKNNKDSNLLLDDLAHELSDYIKNGNEVFNNPEFNPRFVINNSGDIEIVLDKEFIDRITKPLS